MHEKQTYAIDIERLPRPNQNGGRVITYDHRGFHGDVVRECKVSTAVHLDQTEDEGVVGGGRLQLGNGACKERNVRLMSVLKKILRFVIFSISTSFFAIIHLLMDLGEKDFRVF